MAAGEGDSQRRPLPQTPTPPKQKPGSRGIEALAQY